MGRDMMRWVGLWGTKAWKSITSLCRATFTQAPLNPIMRKLLLIVAVLAASGCSRTAVVTTSSSPSQTAGAVKVTNTTPQSVTVYVLPPGGAEFPIGTVAANSTAVLSVVGVDAGARVRLRAALADGSRSYTREGVSLAGVVDWRVP
jgi:hypothetical protein